MLLNNLFTFDIETIPDTEAVKNLTGFESDDVNELRAELDRYHLELTDGKNSFPRQPFHKVVAISFLEAEIERDGIYETYHIKEIRSGGTEDSTEEELVKGFFHYLEKKKPRLISYNGRTFDLPVLKYRAMKYGISSELLYNAGDKWNNYTQRYSLDWHCDLLEALSDFGASARVKLNEVCAILNCPGKIGVDGSQVATMHDDGKIKEIRDYCETDVINTYLVYLRYMQHRGNLPANAYEKAINDLTMFLEKNSEKSEHFGEFLQEWRN